MPKISVVILCYKAGQAVPGFAARVREIVARLTEDWEIVLVGNFNRGDADATPDIVRDVAASDPRFTAVVREKQGMMGWDARSGLRAATGEAVAIIDGDNQMPPENLEHVYNALVREGLDMAMTYRRDRKDSWIRRYNSSRIFNFLYNALFPGYPVRDVNSKPKIFSRALLDKLHLTADDWFFDTEIMIQARRHKARLKQIPTVFYRSMDRKSFVRPDALREFAKNLLVARFREFFVTR